jgi:hypothetical protein
MASAEELEALLPYPLRVLGPVSGGGAAPPATAVLAAHVGGGAAAYRAPGGAAFAPQLLAYNPLQESHALVRCALELVLEVPSASPAAVDAAFAALESQLQSPDVAFLVLAPGGERTLAGPQTLKAAGGSWQLAVGLQPVVQTPAGAAPAAPAPAFAPAPAAVSASTLLLDVLCYVPLDTPTARAAGAAARPALLAQLRAMRRLAAAAAAAGAPPPPLRALHFLPPGLAHHVTAVYPLPRAATEGDEAALQRRRAALHAALGLPADRPLLRLANAVDPGGAAGPSGASSQQAQQQAQRRLVDVHLGLLPSGVAGGSVHLVQGSYEYFHYMQDRTDDSGCAPAPAAPRAARRSAPWDAGAHVMLRARAAPAPAAACRLLIISARLAPAHRAAPPPPRCAALQLGLRLPLAADPVLLVPPAALRRPRAAHPPRDPGGAGGDGRQGGRLPGQPPVDRGHRAGVCAGLAAGGAEQGDHRGERGRDAGARARDRAPLRHPGCARAARRPAAPAVMRLSRGFFCASWVP